MISRIMIYGLNLMRKLIFFLFIMVRFGAGLVPVS